METLGPKVPGLSDQLIAHFRAVDFDGNFMDGEPEIAAPLQEGGGVSNQFNWQSPFEQMGPESKAPAITAMLQSGALTPLASRLQGIADNAASNSNSPIRKLGLEAIGNTAGSVKETLNQLRGRTGVTKLNSTQIFSGLPPTKLSITLILRAWADPVAEVMLPLMQIYKWASPQYLAPDSILVGILAGTNGQSGILNNLLPSKAPQLLYFRYGQRVYSPVVIESFEEPLTAPRDRNGNYTEVVLPMTIATYQSLDAKDIPITFSRGPQPSGT